MKREIVIPFDGDFTQESRETLIKALEEQLDKLQPEKSADGAMSAENLPLDVSRNITPEIREKLTGEAEGMLC